MAAEIKEVQKVTTSTYTLIDKMYVVVELAKDELTDKVISVQGRCYVNDDGNPSDYIASFALTISDGEVKVSVSDVKRQDRKDVNNTISYVIDYFGLEEK